MSTTLKHLNYLRNGCTGCEIHAEHDNYKKLRDLRTGGNLQPYIDELEFCCTFFQAGNVLAQHMYAEVLKNTQWSRIAGNVPKQQAFSIVYQGIMAYVNFSVGQVTMD